MLNSSSKYTEDENTSDLLGKTTELLSCGYIWSKTQDPFWRRHVHYDHEEFSLMTNGQAPGEPGGKKNSVYWRSKGYQLIH